VRGSPPPAWARVGGCGNCNFGTLIYPDVRKSYLPLYIRDALLHEMDEVAWCGCPFGQARKAYALRTLAKIHAARAFWDDEGKMIGTVGEYIDPTARQLFALHVAVAHAVAEAAQVDALIGGVTV